jgi:cytochrome P450 family 110
VHLDLTGGHTGRLLAGLRAVGAGLDPDGYFRRQAGRPEPFAIAFPGFGQVLFVANAKGARDILTASAQNTYAPLPNPIQPIVGKGSLILSSGEEHRQKRRLLMPAFQGERMRARAGVMAEAVVDETRNWRPGDLVTVRSAAQSITLRVIIRAVFGVDDRDRIDEYSRVVKAFMGSYTAPLMLLPALRRDLRGRGPWARLVRLRDEFDALLTEDIEARRRRRNSDRSDVLSVLLTASDGGATFSDEDLLQQLRTLVVAGHETTATALAWALYEIHRDSGIRDRVNAELSGSLTPHEMTALPYLSAVIHETLRMHPTVPIVLRRLAGPLTVGGVPRAAGDVVGIAVPALHFDSAVFEAPDEFRPERFLDKSPTPFEYVPFGGGYRRCIGAAFAGYELAVVIGTMMSTLVLDMPPRERNGNPPRSVPRGIAVVPHREIMLQMTGRLSPATNVDDPSSDVMPPA